MLVRRDRRRVSALTGYGRLKQRSFPSRRTLRGNPGLAMPRSATSDRACRAASALWTQRRVRSLGSRNRNRNRVCKRSRAVLTPSAPFAGERLGVPVAARARPPRRAARGAPRSLLRIAPPVPSPGRARLPPGLPRERRGRGGARGASTRASCPARALPVAPLCAANAGLCEVAAEILAQAAARAAGFRGALLADFPHSGNPAKKLFLCLRAPRPPSGGEVEAHQQRREKHGECEDFRGILLVAASRMTWCFSLFFDQTPCSVPRCPLAWPIRGGCAGWWWRGEGCCAHSGGGAASSPGDGPGEDALGGTCRQEAEHRIELEHKRRATPQVADSRAHSRASRDLRHPVILPLCLRQVRQPTAPVPAPVHRDGSSHRVVAHG